VNQLAQVGRLAFRHEGDWWVVYWAPETHTMTGAVELGRVAIALVQTHVRRDQFIQFARDVYADMAEQAIGVRPVFPIEPQPAPEHERAGNS
jgi:hypothetical protein